MPAPPIPAAGFSFDASMIGGISSAFSAIGDYFVQRADAKIAQYQHQSNVAIASANRAEQAKLRFDAMLDRTTAFEARSILSGIGSSGSVNAAINRHLRGEVFNQQGDTYSDKFGELSVETNAAITKFNIGSILGSTVSKVADSSLLIYEGMTDAS